MDGAIVIAGIALIAFALALLARKARRNSTAGAALAGAMAAYNEAWHSTAYSTYTEMQSQADRVAPSDSPEDQYLPDLEAARWPRCAIASTKQP